MWTKEEENLLLEKYENTRIQELEEILGRTRRAICNKAQRLGLTSEESRKKKTSLGRKVHTYDSHFFSSPNIQNSYVAGLIASDGNLCGNILSIGLQEEDKELLEEVKVLLEFSGELYYTPSREASVLGKRCTAKAQYKLQVGIDKNTIEDLERNFHITERKSLTLVPPNLEGELRLSFVAGLIDGDGTVKVAKVRGKYRYLNVGFYGNKEVSTWVKETFEGVLGHATPVLVRNQKSGLYYAGLNGENAITFMLAMNRLEIPRMERKQKVFSEFVIPGVNILDLNNPVVVPGKINVTPDEYRSKSELLSSMTGPKKKIPARKTKVVELDSKTFSEFLEKNHLEGKAPAKEKIGLVYEGTLVSVAGFQEISDEFVLVRFCSILGVTIVGGLSKLLSKYKDIEVVTFSDLRYSLGEVYEKVGFNRVKDNPKRLYYTDGKNLLNRRGFQKKAQERKFPYFSWNSTEKENAEKNGYRQIFLGGTTKWVLPANTAKLNRGKK